MKLVFQFLALSALLVLGTGCGNDSTSSNDPASEAPEDALFRLVPASQSGIDFHNRIKETFRDNIVVNSYLYNGGGVAIIDINNDGLEDVYFTSTQGENRLYLNKGNLQFEDITTKAGVSLPSGIKTGVTVCDVNNDGLSDLYVCRSGMQPTATRRNALFINNGDLTFTESAEMFGLADQSASNHASFFDFDNDGDLDCYIVNHPVEWKDVNRIDMAANDSETGRPKPKTRWDSDRLLRQESDGTFTDVSAAAGIQNRGWGLSVTISDFNRDGNRDILVGNDYIEPDYLYINNGDGTFTDRNDEYFRHTSNHTMGVDIGDVNNDGFMDFVAMDMIAEDNFRQKALMTTMMLDRYNTLVNAGYGHQIMRNTLNLNTGGKPVDGRMYSDIGVMAGISNTDWSWSPLMGDFDNDGLKDIYVTNGYRRDVTDLDYLTYTVDSVMRSGGLSPRQFDSIQQYLSLIPSKPLVNYMFKNTNGYQFEQVMIPWGMNQPSFSNGSAYADLDNDGDLDLLVNQIDNEALVYENRSADRAEQNWIQIKLKGDAKNTDAIGSTVRLTFPDNSTQVTEVTASRGFYSASTLIAHFGLGSHDRAKKIEIEWPSGDYVHTLDSVIANQRYVVERSYAAKGALPNPSIPNEQWPKFEATEKIAFEHQENSFIDFDRQLMLPHMFSTEGPHAAIADINNDGWDDIYIGGAKNQAGALFLQDGNGGFVPSPMTVFDEDARYEDTDAVFIDVDNDGDQDLFVTSGGNSERKNSPLYADRLYINNGDAKFVRPSSLLIPEDNTSSSVVEVLDFDGDGDSDLIVGGLITPGEYPNIPRSRLLENKDGKFTDVTRSKFKELETIGHVKDIKWTDLDNDSKNELIIAGEWLPIEVFQFESDAFRKKTADFGLDETNGWWNCIEIADLDNDGDLDLVGGNLGLNTRLTASRKYPLKLYAADFDNNNQVDAIMSYYDDGVEYPLAKRDVILKQLPYLKKKYVKNRGYSRSSVDQVFSKQELQNAQQFEAYDFANVWYENQDGRFIRHELNVEAQIAPCFAIHIEDIDGNSTLDLILAGNDFGADVETGRLDAGSGIILLNNGQGEFEYAPNWGTSFWATGQVREINGIDIPGGSMLVVLNNNAPVVTYQRVNN